ncbi:ABC transporter permease [Streptomyces litchfieldiae]|uniref:ABC-2 family transporter protein n=1 Tax=Streptomyces litchfieldiae TaxID=3075543 RepID=A0ABU2MRY6_9ACTN|nr:ABC-2 family transporter protein [Streptomyces sp. DSM 44938]MDT0344391.1 ABC-2 family transporter protein [Streptomyces sp. DSM 44938]
MSAANPVPRHRAYRILVGAAFRGQLQYRGNLLLTLAGGVAYQGIGLVFLWTLTTRFGDLGGWSMAEIAFLYGMRVTAHGLLMVPTSQLHYLDQSIRTGEFDRYLVRPAGPLMQLLCRQIHVPTLGDLFTGVVVLAVAAHQVGFRPTPAALLYLCLALVGGAMVEGACQLAFASFSFRMMSNLALRGLLDDIMNTFGGYPLKVFPDTARLGLTYLVPVAFVAYLPAGVLLDRTDGLHVTAWLAYGAPLVGPLLYAAAYLLWRTQLRHYSSSGT